MGKARIGAIVLAAGLAVAGCGSDKGDAAGPGMRPGPGEQTSTAPPTPAVAASSPNAFATASPAGIEQLGTPAITRGTMNIKDGPGGAPIELTPSTIVYSTKTVASTPQRGLFITVVIKQRPTAGAAAKAVDLSDGGGWQYITPDGQAIRVTTVEALSVYPKGYFDASTRPVQPGTSTWDSHTWDITDAQRGGVLMYTDSAKKEWRWQVPAQDAGSEVDAVKKALS